ncbi:MAG: GMC family oxidoreductase, partial [Spirochaetales bacterium]
MVESAGEETIYDYIIIGSGFGGSISALRLVEKGYTVLVLEEGRWFEDTDFPPTNNNPFRYLWMPRLLCRGFQRITFLKHAAIMGAAGVGGGSINYANTLLDPPEHFYSARGLPDGVDWKSELQPFLSAARDMYRPAPVPCMTQMDTALKETAEELGVGDSFYQENVAVFFGEPEQSVPDPYFGGKGPERTGCTLCSGCMIGCRVGAKNTLLKNYLHLAIGGGATVIAESRVVDLVRADDGTCTVQTERPGVIAGKGTRRFRARNVVFSAGVLGTLRLLFTLKQAGRLDISDRLGFDVRTNSETLIGVRKPGRDVNLSEGVAITSGVYLDDGTHIEVVRYPEGANILSFLSTLLTDKHRKIWRPLSMIWNILKNPLRAMRVLNPAGWARQSIILLVMQTEDNCIRIVGRGRRRGTAKLQSVVDENATLAPVYIPQAHDFSRKMAAKLGGVPLSNIYEVFF